MRTELNFKFLDDNRDCTTIAILDASTYNPDITTTCPIIDVIVPNFSSKKSFEYVPSTTLLINTQVLTLSTSKVPLPTGLYNFRFSVNPNDTIYKTYNYLHICADLASLGSILCLDSCGDIIEKVMKLKRKLEAAKFLVEYCNDTVKGVFLYNETIKEIANLSKKINGNCTTC